MIARCGACGHRMFGWRVLYRFPGEAQAVPCHWKCTLGAILLGSPLACALLHDHQDGGAR